MRAALAAHAGGDFQEAIRLYNLVLRADSGHFEALHNLGHVLLQQDRPAEAATAFERALHRRPDAARSHNMLAHALVALGRHQEAIERHRRALDLQPDYAQAHHDLGRLLAVMGRLDEARASLQAAIALSPGRGAYYRSLSEVTRFTQGDAALAAMESLLQDAASMNPIDRVELHFALGKAYADVGRHPQSFAQFSQGAALVRRHVGYNEAGTLGLLDQVRAAFSNEVMAAKAGAGDPSVAPIFILGMPRSGSTLVEQILASHPAVFGAGELTAFRDVAAHVLGHPSRVASADGETFRQIGRRYLQAAGAGATTPRFTDKMPANFIIAGLIHLALPNARIIHTVRDPVDTCLSCFSTLFAGGQEYSYDLAEMGRFYRGYCRLMDHWRQVLPTGVMMEVQYEDLVADVEGEARRIIGHCGLAWDDACLAFHRTERPVRTASAVQVRQPIYTSSVGRWRPAPKDLAPLLAALGLTGQPEEK